jgi:predicted Rossmann fold nucleotide-binding protein DprA/Smf involved in DNA uptake
METEKCAAMIKRRHSAEVEAFTEQLRLEAFRWRAMNVEATRVRCRIQQMEARLAQQEQHSAVLEARAGSEIPQALGQLRNRVPLYSCST